MILILKKRKKRTYSFSFTGHLITQPLIHNYQKSVAVVTNIKPLAQKCGHKKLCN